MQQELTQNRAKLYLLKNQTRFPSEKLVYIKQSLDDADELTLERMEMLQLKNPMSMLLFSLFLGFLGIDRFLLGSYAIGLVKLLSFVSLITIFISVINGVGSIFTPLIMGVFAVILQYVTYYDWITIYRKTQKYNFRRLTEVLIS